MANIQPFDYQKSTNIEEHNQIVDKVNEIVQVINNVNLDTINSEIANLKANATATDTEIANIKNKDTQQDTEIDGITKSLVSDVTATFDNPTRELKISLGRKASPSIDATVVIPASSESGQYSAGNGITIENYQIAVDTGVVALKTDIQTINTEITDITNKNTEQDTAIAGKVAISQGVENAGKVLGIGVDGNVTPVDGGGSSGGGEVWEKVDLQNWPTDWAIGDRIRVDTTVSYENSGASSWSTSLPAGSFQPNNLFYNTFEGTVGETGRYCNKLLQVIRGGFFVAITSVSTIFGIDKFNDTTSSNKLFIVSAVYWNGYASSIQTLDITHENKNNYIVKMWRCRASS